MISPSSPHGCFVPLHLLPFPPQPFNHFQLLRLSLPSHLNSFSLPPTPTSSSSKACTVPFYSDISCLKHISHHLICIRFDPFHFLNFLQSTTLASVEFVLSKTPVALVCLPCLESSSCSASLKHKSTHNIVSDLGHLS